MATLLVIVSRPSCSACGAHLQIYSDKGSNTCSTCQKLYCSSCYGLKLKLDSAIQSGGTGSAIQTGGTGGTCSSCDNLARKKRGHTAPAPQLHSPSSNTASQLSNTDTQHGLIPKLPVTAPRPHTSTYFAELDHRQSTHTEQGSGDRDTTGYGDDDRANSRYAYGDRHYSQYADGEIDMNGYGYGDRDNSRYVAGKTGYRDGGRQKMGYGYGDKDTFGYGYGDRDTTRHGYDRDNIGHVYGDRDMIGHGYSDRDNIGYDYGDREKVGYGYGDRASSRYVDGNIDKTGIVDGDRNKIGYGYGDGKRGNTLLRDIGLKRRLNNADGSDNRFEYLDNVGSSRQLSNSKHFYKHGSGNRAAFNDFDNLRRVHGTQDDEYRGDAYGNQRSNSQGYNEHGAESHGAFNEERNSSRGQSTLRNQQKTDRETRSNSQHFNEHGSVSRTVINGVGNLTRVYDTSYNQNQTDANDDPRSSGRRYNEHGSAKQTASNDVNNTDTVQSTSNDQHQAGEYGSGSVSTLYNKTNTQGGQHTYMNSNQKIAGFSNKSNSAQRPNNGDARYTRDDQATLHTWDVHTTGYTAEGQASDSSGMNSDTRYTGDVQATRYSEEENTTRYTGEGHTTRYDNTVSGGSSSNTDHKSDVRRYEHGGGLSHQYSYDDPYFDDDDEFGDEYVPSYDEIPFALILTGAIDHKTLMKAKRVQEQKIALQVFANKGEAKRTTQRPVNKNKNYMASKKTTANGSEQHITQYMHTPKSPEKSEITRNSGRATDDDEPYRRCDADKQDVLEKKETAPEKPKRKQDIHSAAENLKHVAEDPNKDTDTIREKRLAKFSTGQFNKPVQRTQLESNVVDVKGKETDVIKRNANQEVQEDTWGSTDCDQKTEKTTSIPKIKSGDTMNSVKNKKKDLENNDYLREYIRSLDEQTSAGARTPEENNESLQNKDMTQTSTHRNHSESGPNKARAETRTLEENSGSPQNKDKTRTKNNMKNEIEPREDVTSKSVKNKDNGGDDGADSDDDIPFAMQLAKGQDNRTFKTENRPRKAKTKNTKIPKNENTGEKDTTKKNGDDDDDIPYAMQLANPKYRKEEESKSLMDFLYGAADDEEFADSPLNLLKSRYSQEKTGSMKSVKSDITKRKNKNKNMGSATPERNAKTNEGDGAKGNLFLIFLPPESEPLDTSNPSHAEANKKETDKAIQQKSTSVNKNATEKAIQQSGEHGPPKTSLMGMLIPVLTLSIADSRHKAFRQVRQAQSESHLKCTSCGRPECKGHNMKKMKEMIRASKQAGFEVRDVIPDGNCMFAAVIDQLNLHGDYTFGAKSLREAAVAWLIENPCSDDGTHFQSFLEEEWDVYLGRMVTEGQWGDHVILRAVVEVIRHTVKVLNVGSTDSHWTILEPRFIDPIKDDKHLILGHVGEFHYTSLRPTDGMGTFIQAPTTPTPDTPITEGSGQLTLEGSETVEMFREDYVDPWSDMPVAHFSYVLKRIIPITCLDEAAIYTSQMCDEVEGPTERFEVPGVIRTTGCIAESVYLSYLSPVGFDDSTTTSWENLKLAFIPNDVRVVYKTDTERQTGDLVIDEAGVHPGYTKIISSQRYEADEGSVTRYMPNSHKDTLSYVRQTDDSIKQMYGSRYANMSITSKGRAFTCLSWPSAAVSWKTRIRREGWPSEEIIASVVSEGCLVMPLPHKNSQNPDIEWQFSFALAEKKLFRECLSRNQKYCFILFKALCGQTLQQLDSISHDHLKSVFFYACERIPAEFWSSCPGACVLYMLDELLRYTQERNLPNYFIQSNNMLDILLDRDFQEIENQINLLRSQPLLFVRQIQENAQFLYQGNDVIEKVSDDIPVFKIHRSVQRSTLEVFVPSTILIAQGFIKNADYKTGYEMLGQAYEERLSVSTCDDSVPYQLFLQGAITGLDLNSLVWFSAFADKNLAGQISGSLIAELSGGMPLMKIKEILPADVAGCYGDTEVPVEFLQNIFNFCNDFAIFLYKIEKKSAALPVLLFCVDKYHELLKTRENTTCNDTSQYLGANDDEALDYWMLEIFTGLFRICSDQQRKVEPFKEYLLHFERVCERINNKFAYSWLVNVYSNLQLAGLLQADGDLQRLSMKCLAMPTVNDPIATYRIQRAMYWPNVKRCRIPVQ